MDVRTFYGKRFESIAAATDYASHESHTNFDFAIIPPNTGHETDEDDIDEGNLLHDDLPHDIPGELELLCSSDNEDDVPLADLRKSILAPSAIKWSKRAMNMDSTKIFETSKHEMNIALEGKTPVEVFENLLIMMLCSLLSGKL